MPTYFLKFQLWSIHRGTYPQVLCYDCENRTSSESPKVASRSNLEPKRDTVMNASALPQQRRPISPVALDFSQLANIACQPWSSFCPFSLDPLTGAACIHSRPLRDSMLAPTMLPAALSTSLAKFSPKKFFHLARKSPLSLSGFNSSILVAVTEGSGVTTGCAGEGSRDKGQKLDHGWHTRCWLWI
jgi:hypothetical protein